MEKTLTDNEIVKALECCGRIEPNDCDNCPYGYKDMCTIDLKRDALDLIDRIQAKNEKLQIVKKLIDTLIHKDCEYATSEAYEKAFQRALQRLYDNTNAKAEAYKEFWGELKKQAHTHHCRYVGQPYDITAVEIEDGDNLLKEMVGE